MKTIYTLLIGTLFFISLNAQEEAEKFFNSAETKSQNGDYDGAIKEYTKAIEADPEMINAYLQRGFAYTLNQDYNSAVKDYTMVLEIEGDHLWAYMSRGSAFNKLEKFNEALKDFNKALTIDPENQEAFNNRGWAKKGLGDTKGACADWKKSKKMGNAEAKIILKNNKCK
jgi:tetratricopeptide (TPR) repeat protein